jgi:hypothetical protein
MRIENILTTCFVGGLALSLIVNHGAYRISSADRGVPEYPIDCLLREMNRPVKEIIYIPPLYQPEENHDF